MGQVVPFMFVSYYIIFSLDIFVPIQGRSDPSMNPDLLIAVILFGLTLMMGGLLMPTLSLFQQSFYIVCTFLVIFLAFVICMATPLGFAYKSAVSSERFWIFVRNYWTFIVLSKMILLLVFDSIRNDLFIILAEIYVNKILFTL